MCGENRHTDIENLATLIHAKKLIHCVTIFTILYGNYYPPLEELQLICIGKFASRTWVNFTQQYGKNRQRYQQNTFYYAVWQLLLYYYRELPSKIFSVSKRLYQIFATFVYVFTMRMVIYDILSMAIIPTLSTSILFCNFCYILLWISPRSVTEIAIRI